MKRQAFALLSCLAVPASGSAWAESAAAVADAADPRDPAVRAGYRR